MIVSNASSYFAAVTRMTAATWKRWEGEAVGAIADSMAVSGFDEATIGAYLDAAGVSAGESSITLRKAWRSPKRMAASPLGT